MLDMDSADGGATEKDANPSARATVDCDTGHEAAATSEVVVGHMEHLGTRLNILETELKYAWRALDLLSQEYVKMWERLEKLESLLCEQQTVISQLLDFYSSVEQAQQGVAVDSAVPASSELDTLQQVLNLAETGSCGLSEEATEIIKELQLEDMLHLPDESFYRNLNKAYREDVTGYDVGAAPLSSAASQLGMIWEEAEEGEENGNSDKKEVTSLEMEIASLKEEENVFSSLDYKDYKKNMACVSDGEMAQLSRLSAMDQAALEQLHELDRLTNKLQQDSLDLRHLQSQLLEPPHQSAPMDSDFSAKDTSIIDEQLRHIYSDAELENWTFSSSSRGLAEMLLLAGITSSAGFDTDFLNNEQEPETASISPRHRATESSHGAFASLSTSPRCDEFASFTSISGSPKRNELSYSYSNSAMHNIDIDAYGPAQYSSIACTSPSMYSVSSGKLSASPVSVVSVRLRQDPYISGATKVDLGDETPSPSSPPPPAPQDKDDFMKRSLDSYFGASPLKSVPVDQMKGRLTTYSQHSLKSPRTSPKRVIKSTSSSIAPAKSDSGLSSMSGGWSSLEKSPGSPKGSKSYTSPDTGILLGRVPCHTHSRSHSASQLNVSPKRTEKSPLRQESDPYSYTHTHLPVPGGSSALSSGSASLSAFTAVKSPTAPDSSSSAHSDSFGTFVPSPAPSSDVSVSPSRRPLQPELVDYSYHSAIYSVAGSHRQPYTSVYTNGSSNYGSTAASSSYPDVVSHYPISDTSSSSSQYHAGSEQGTSRSHSTSTSMYPTPTTTPTQYAAARSRTPNVAQLDCYKTAMHRTMFPTGQITDALTYYPAAGSSSHWMSQSMDGSQPSSYYPERSVQSPPEYKKPILDPSAQYKAEEGYPIPDRKWNRRDWNSELDIRNESYENEPYSETGGVIVSQSGYISISDLQPSPAGANLRNRNGKKVKRGGSLKSSMTSAMSSVSNWLPEIHLTKRHRSNSLPGDEYDNEGEQKPKSTLRGKLQKQLTIAKRKGQKIAAVTTLTGMLQKVKKKGSQSSPSLSDPEQSDLDWAIGSRSGTLSTGSEDSVFADNPADLFAKMPTHTTGDSDSADIDVTAEKLPELGLSLDDFDDEKVVSPMVQTSISTLFPTVGEVKQTTSKSTTGSSDESVGSDGAIKLPQVNIGSASREFAVSRALSKYRQRQNSVISDEKIGQDESGASDGNGKDSAPEKTPEESDNPDIVIKEISSPETKTEASPEAYGLDVSEQFATVQKVAISSVSSPPMQTTPTPPVVEVVSTAAIQMSPSLQSVRSQRMMPSRHQQSLDVPWGMRSLGEGDEDTRSTYSWRSTSRVSSRRQSTEDSIDSEDEWYCYELRKLEEMERQAEVETFDPMERYKPDDKAKQQMGFVLKELQLKASQVNILDEPPMNKFYGSMRDDENKADRKRAPMERRLSADRRKLPEIRPSLERRMSRELPARPNEIIQPKEVRIEETKKIEESDDEKEGSSGDTSGPDSPQQSDGLEFENDPEIEEGVKESDPCGFPTMGSHATSTEQMELVSGPEESERDSNAVLSEVYEDDDGAMLALKAERRVRIVEPDQEDRREDGKEGGPGSKWKLLKALKERKAEEKEAEAAAKVEEPPPVVSRAPTAFFNQTDVSSSIEGGFAP